MSKLSKEKDGADAKSVLSKNKRPSSPVSKALESIMEVKLERVQMGKITDFPAKFQGQLQNIMAEMKNNFALQLKALQEEFVN